MTMPSFDLLNITIGGVVEKSLAAVLLILLVLMFLARRNEP